MCSVTGADDLAVTQTGTGRLKESGMRPQVQRSCKSCLQATVCKGFPMTLHRCSILCSPAGGTFLATLPVLSGMSVHQGLYMHEVLQKLLASYRLQGVPDDLTQVPHPLFTRWWHFSCHVAGLVWDVSASRALICSRLQIPVCKGFPMTLRRCSILCSPAGGTFLATLPVLSGMSVHQGL